VRDAALEVDPDPPVAAAVVASAQAGAVFVDGAVVAGRVAVDAPPVGALAVEVGLVAVPLDDALVEVLLGQRHPQPAARRMAQREAGLAVDRVVAVLDGVLVGPLRQVDDRGISRR
jgi:hypothetical protein